MIARLPLPGERYRWRGLVIVAATGAFVASFDAVAAAGASVASPDAVAAAGASVVPFDPLAAAGESGSRSAAVTTYQDSAGVAATDKDEQANAPAGPAIELIEAGWDGVATPSSWTPVRLGVRGGARDMRVLVEAIAEARSQPWPSPRPGRYSAGAYGREVSLPARSVAEVLLWVPAQNSLRARLSSGDEILAETEIPLELTRAGWPLIGVLADAPTIARTVTAIELPYQGVPLPLDAAELAPHAIPSSSERFDGVSAFIVQGAVTAELTGAQRAAILDWVRQGGHLIIAGGPNAAEAARILPEGALPVRYEQTDASAALAGLNGWLASSIGEIPSTAPAAIFRPSAGAGGVVLAGSADSPLAWRAPLGRGTVTVLAVDPGLEPLASWSGAPALLRAVLEPALADAESADGDLLALALRQSMRAPSRLNEVAGLLPTDARPRWPVAAAILAAFAIAVGPALYLVLRLLDRRGLSWIVVPAAAIGVSAGIYLWSVRVSGADVLTNVVSYIEIPEGDGPTRQSVMAAFYGPMHRELTVPLGADVFVRPTIGGLPYDAPRVVIGQMITRSSGKASVPAEEGPPPEPAFQLIDGTDRRVRFNTGQYTVRALRFERDLAEAPRVRAELRTEGGLLVGTVRNETGLPLEDAAVIVGRSVARLGALAPGQSAPVRLDAATASQPSLGHEPLSWLVFGEPVGAPAGAQRSPGSPESRTMPTDPEIRRRGHFLDIAFQTPRMFMTEPQVPLTFIAYTRARSIDEALLPGQRKVHLTLIRQPTELSLPPGPFSVPAGLIPPDAIDVSRFNDLGGGGNGQIVWIELRSGAITYSFRPPLPAGTHVETLTLTTEQVGTAPPRPPSRGANARPSGPTLPGLNDEVAVAADPGVFSVFDWENAAWTPLPDGSEHRLEAGPYVGPANEVRVRVSHPGDPENPELQFLPPSLAVEGHAGEGVPE